jgi:hypothetical protein
MMFFSISTRCAFFNSKQVLCSQTPCQDSGRVNVLPRITMSDGIRFAIAGSLPPNMIDCADPSM